MFKGEVISAFIRKKNLQEDFLSNFGEDTGYLTEVFRGSSGAQTQPGIKIRHKK
jgi:hypothetical protein